MNGSRIHCSVCRSLAGISSNPNVNLGNVVCRECLRDPSVEGQAKIAALLAYAEAVGVHIEHTRTFTDWRLAPKKETPDAGK